jgi:hypothetical protein
VPVGKPTERLSEVSVVLLESESGRGVEDAADAGSRVDHEARDVASELEKVALEDVVADGLGVLEVTEEVRYAGSHRARRHLDIAFCHRMQDRMIECSIELEHGAVVPLCVIA